MNINLASNESLSDVESQIKSRFAAAQNKGVSIRVHPGLSYSLNEITRGLARLFPHRRSVAYFRGAGPYFEPLMTFFSMEGYQLQALDFQHLEQPSWFANLGKDTLFVLAPEDDLMTGQAFNWKEASKELNDKRVFTVSVSYARHRADDEPELRPYAVRVLSGAPNLSLALLGEKALKVEALAFGPNSWSTQVTDPGMFTKSGDCDSKKILAFEAQGWGGAQALFSKSQNRLFDRAAIYWPDMDGEALMQVVSQKMGWKLNPPGSEKRIETTSLCRWGGLKTFDWLKEQGWTSEQIRGLVIVSNDVVSDDLGRAIEQARAEILKLQGS